LLAADRPLESCASSAVFVVLYDAADCRAWSGSRIGAGLSDLPMRDLLNHDAFEERPGVSTESFNGDLKLLSDNFRPRSLGVDAFGRNGSTASVKYS
jgi:hypothetical protein